MRGPSVLPGTAVTGVSSTDHHMARATVYMYIAGLTAACARTGQAEVSWQLAAGCDSKCVCYRARTCNGM